MKKKILALSAITAAMISLTGCGAGDAVKDAVDSVKEESKNVGVAYYLDSAVGGIDYTCGTQKGTTGEDGSFKFDIGKSCTFYLGDIKFKEINEKFLSNGKKIVEDDVAIAMLLQSLDTDGDASNGITISKEVVKAIVEALSEDGREGALPQTEGELKAVLAVLDDVNGYKGKFVSKEDAKKHLDVTHKNIESLVTKELLAGKTFYTSYVEDNVQVIEKIKVNADATSASFSQVVGGSETGTMKIAIEGNTFSTEDEDGIQKHKIIAISTNYLQLKNLDTSKIENLYFSKASLEEYLKNVKPVPEMPGEMTAKKLLSGQSFYMVNMDVSMGSIEKISFSEDGSFGSWTEIIGGSEESGDVKVSFDGSNFTITEEQEKPEHFEIKNISKEYILITNTDKNKDTKIYFQLDEAKEALKEAGGRVSEKPNKGNNYLEYKGLKWQDNEGLNNSLVNYGAKTDYCKYLEIDGLSWRVPLLEEYKQLNEVKDKLNFAWDKENYIFWTATEDEKTIFAYNLQNGKAPLFYFDKMQPSDEWGIRCVSGDKPKVDTPTLVETGNVPSMFQHWHTKEELEKGGLIAKARTLIMLPSSEVLYLSQGDDKYDYGDKESSSAGKYNMPHLETIAKGETLIELINGEDEVTTRVIYLGTYKKDGDAHGMVFTKIEDIDRKTTSIGLLHYVGYDKFYTEAVKEYGSLEKMYEKLSGLEKTKEI